MHGMGLINQFSENLTFDTVAIAPDPASGRTTAAWADGHEWRALRDKRYTYARYLKDGRELLFDRRADPFGLKNLADDARNRKTLDDYRARCRAKMAELKDDFHTCTWYRDHWTVNRVIMRGAKGPFHRRLGPDVPVDPNYNPYK